ncbi:hypothetical protein Rumeso_01549 [Rubellimicrobium mesophilum DSM 19309]|uniref:Arabinan endo-1,5-alpha-L-arabinosidase n=1 Tax=Rubellimicrobium mesophilum DSM 19309 TaxID=442562 RepID=A0A017HQG0_9RHOB|nr:family 43 glycosylhydrolase [Rubellimicrobium mesophilum]EYD76591.1 hypothetical protein Rumeso_01549 [Rubellimicrobium mesophilum DSM 19309]
MTRMGASLIAALALLGWAVAAQEGPGRTTSSPLPMVAEGRAVESCADPTAIEAEGGWTMLCTSDPLWAGDRYRLLPMFRSEDLVHWSHAGDAFDRDEGTAVGEPPGWASRRAMLWAPEIEEIGGRFYLFFGVTDVRTGGEPACDSDGAIGYAVGETSVGPWVVAEAPLIAPRRAGPGCDFLWTYDPEVVATPEGRRFIYYGSYYGGIEARELTVLPDGSLWADPGTAVPVAVAGRYEGAEVVERDGAWWLFVSSSNCCNGPQTGYAVFAGRADGPLGPFRDRDEASFLDARAGGTPVIVQNGNGWVGPGHDTVLQDRAGQWWTIYHAVEEARPWFGEEVGFTRRPALLDRLDWVDGWPVVVGGPSEGERAAPALEAGKGSGRRAGSRGGGGRGAAARVLGRVRRDDEPPVAAGCEKRRRPGSPRASSGSGRRTRTSTRTATTRRCCWRGRRRGTSWWRRRWRWTCRRGAASITCRRESCSTGTMTIT